MRFRKALPIESGFREQTIRKRRNALFAPRTRLQRCCNREGHIPIIKRVGTCLPNARVKRARTVRNSRSSAKSLRQDVRRTHFRRRRTSSPETYVKTIYAQNELHSVPTEAVSSAAVTTGLPEILLSTNRRVRAVVERNLCLDRLVQRHLHNVDRAKDPIVLTS